MELDDRSCAMEKLEEIELDVEEKGEKVVATSLPFCKGSQEEIMVDEEVIPKAPRRRLSRQRSWSSQAICEEAWERRRDQSLLDELRDLELDPAGKDRALGRSASDCGQKPPPLASILEESSPATPRLRRTRTRSLTDDDLEELRGCIDLGFRFDCEDPRLCETLPALEICHALRHFQENGSEPSGSSSPVEWKIASPGDHPQVVKTRLRHWAQAVACTVRQCC
ncbi:uncharacterized protein LOC9631247 [Selaginella moellendorffii]|nr:uncharacterized protein LOC9631247 [Selaginella moellendorffii]|eukprot:XP_002968414.2 uncharacterized protein LOC9631247 [Selaginella moellendorffii]